MPLFRRRGSDDEDSYADGSDASVGGDVTVAAGGSSGPWDVDDLPDDDEVQRLDLGALRVPVPDGCEVRVDVQDDQVVAATVVDGRSALQIHGFAAPRREGIWDDVRTEIAESLRSSGGSADEVDGPFGRELRARIPSAEPGHGQALQPARFLGVDGSRWFLRGLMTGAAATDPQQARMLEDVFRDVVVVRGGEAMAPRDLLPLRLPREALQQLQPEETEPAKPTLDMLERGPEITETR